MTDPTAASTEDRPPTTSAPSSTRSEVGALLLALLAAGVVAQAASYAHAAATAAGGIDIGPTSGVQADLDWERFLLAFTSQASFLPAILLSLAVLAVRPRPWSELAPAVRATCWIAFPLGLVVAASGAYAFVEGVVGDDAAFAFGGESSGIVARVAASAPSVLAAGLVGHASWSAFGLLPFARAAEPEGPTEVDGGADEAWAPPPASTDRV